ncbi:glutathione S-transferase C-terminal domain-containing protein, partial [Pseudomonas chlororaphis]|uniref:glutathione S-transferase C-terminal domain-containing protein n=1 Tax=Pseudomonas chlororaphis TaxID=587753 RepID=UPI003857BE2E
MRRSYLRHGLYSLALTLLGALAVYLALQYEFRRHGEGEPELIMAFAYMAWYWALPALALPALGCALLSLRAPEKHWELWLDGQRDKIRRALTVLEADAIAELASHFDVAAISVACALGYLDFRHPDLQWRDA